MFDSVAAVFIHAVYALFFISRIFGTSILDICVCVCVCVSVCLLVSA